MLGVFRCHDWALFPFFVVPDQCPRGYELPISPTGNIPAASETKQHRSTGQQTREMGIGSATRESSRPSGAGPDNGDESYTRWGPAGAADLIFDCRLQKYVCLHPPQLRCYCPRNQGGFVIYSDHAPFRLAVEVSPV